MQKNFFKKFNVRRIELLGESRAVVPCGQLAIVPSHLQCPECLEEVGCCWLSKLFIIKTRLTVIFLHASDKHILVSICTVEPHKNAHGNADFPLSVQFVVSKF